MTSSNLVHPEQLKQWLKRGAKAVLPRSVLLWLQHEVSASTAKAPPIGRVRYGSLRRLHPIDPVFGLYRGGQRGELSQCIDRYYIENFLAQNASDIKGRVLEVEEALYTNLFGGQQVTQSDVLHSVAGNPKATIIANLADADHIPSDLFDCIILTQTLQYILDLRAAIRTLHRILKPGGVILATVPGIIKVDRKWNDCWRFTTFSIRQLFSEVFPEPNVTVQGHGNVFVAMCFLYGITQAELQREELQFCDPDYEVTITLRAVK